jgi:hypothetical protein
MGSKGFFHAMEFISRFMSWTIFDSDAMGVWFIFARSAQGLRNEKDVNTSTRVWLTGGNRVDSSQREGAREMDEKTLHRNLPYCWLTRVNVNEAIVTRWPGSTR